MGTFRLGEPLKIPEPEQGFRRECVCGAQGGGVLVLDVAEHTQAQRSVLRVVSADATQYEVVLQDRLAANFVDVFPDGRVFVASSRAAKNDCDQARVYAPDGELIHAFHIGDGVEDVKIDSLGRIWVSYFDEGVFADDLGKGGLVCFDDRGAVQWAFNAQEGHDGFITDCYALHITDSHVWAYRSDDFNLIRVAPDFQVSTWPTGLRGSFCVAIGAGHVIFGPQYEEPKGRLHLLKFVGDRLMPVMAINMLLPSGDDIDAGRWMTRSGTLSLVAENCCFSVSVDELAALES